MSASLRIRSPIAAILTEHSRLLERAARLPRKHAFGFSILRSRHARAHLFRGDAGLAKPLLRAGIDGRIRVGLGIYPCPGIRLLRGCAHALDGEYEIAVPLLEAALERSQEMHLPYRAA